MIKFVDSGYNILILYTLYLVYYISMVESNKFDKIYSKIFNIFVWSNFCKNQAVWNSDSWFDIWFLLWPIWNPKNLFKFWWLDPNLWLIKICVPFSAKIDFWPEEQLQHKLYSEQCCIQSNSGAGIPVRDPKLRSPNSQRCKN